MPADQATPTSAPLVHATLREAVRSPRRRRPTGAPPPLPYRLQTSGIGWLVAAVVLVGLELAVFARGLRGAAVAVNNGRSVIFLDHDRAGKRAVIVRLAAACDPAGAAEVAPEEPGTRRSVRVDPLADEFGATWYDQFSGGCVTYRLHSTSDVEGWFAAELPTLLGFTSRDGLRQALSQRSDGRLQLDPGEAR